MTSGVFKLRNGAAVQVNNEIAAGQQPRSQPGKQLRRTEERAHEVHRSLHPPAGPGDRRQPGHPDRRPPVDPHAVGAAVSAQRHRGRHGDDRVRRRQRRSRPRLHHDAARARHRERRRHRLHRVVERPGPQHHHGPPEAQLRHQRRADPDPGEGGAGPQRPAAGGAGPGHRPRRRPTASSPSMYLGFGSNDARPEPDHRLPDPRRPAEALGDQRRAAGRHPRRPHLRDARLAQARPHGGARHLARRRCATRSPTTTTSPPSAQTKGSMVSVNLVANTEPADRRRIQASSSSSSKTASSSAWARSPTSCSAPRPTTTDVRFNGQNGHLHGHLGPADRELARRHRAGARGAARDPEAAARPA